MTNSMKKAETEEIHNFLRGEKKYTEWQIINSEIKKVSSTKFKLNIPIPTTKFIEDVLITELLSVTKASPWLGFVAIGSGIEFLGKCIDASNPMDWDAKRRSPTDFNDAIKNLNGINRYKDLINRADGFKLYEEFRCGLTHGLAPKGTISLSHGNEDPTKFNGQSGKVNFNIDELYDDFKLACQDVIARNYSEPNKMNRPKAGINCFITIK